VIELNIEPKPDAVLRHSSYGDYPLPTSSNIATIFEDMYRQLLILGEPGSGKTTLLLELTRELIKRAETDDSQQMPVVFNLASWAVKAEPLENWLIERLQVEYQNPRKVARGWVQSGAFLLMLDGLDEVSINKREACVEAINVFRQKYPLVDMAVCSRIADYEMLTNRLDLSGAIVLQPLTHEQIDAYLDHPELTAVRRILSTNVSLQEMVKTPFLLNTIAYAYRDTSSENLKIPQSGNPFKARQAHLFRAYVNKCLSTPSRGQYSAIQTHYYLGWLAQRLVEFKLTAFYIEELQPTWLETQWQLNQYRIGRFLLAIPVAIASFYMYGLAALLFLPGNIKPVESLRWNWRRSLIGACVGGAFFYLIVGSASDSPDQSALSALTIGAAFAISILMLAGLSGSETKIENRIAPNQAIRASRRSAGKGFLLTLLVSSVLTTVVGAVFSVLKGLPVWGSLGYGIGTSVASSIFIAVPLALSLGGSAVLKHALLRLILYRSGDIPWNYAHFLDYCASIGILRKVGGGYIFVHRYLLEYFAEMDNEN